MIPPLEIFRVDKDAALVWCESVSTVEAGKARIDELARKLPAQYVIVSIATGHCRIFGISGPSAARVKSAGAYVVAVSRHGLFPNCSSH